MWTSDDETVRVLAVGVHHEPVPDAVAYRVETPDGVVVISGDTRVCVEVEDLSAGADVLVHEACRASALADLIAGTTFETIFSYHADTVALGAMAERRCAPRGARPTSSPRPTSRPTPRRSRRTSATAATAGSITVGEDLTTVDHRRRS